MTTQDSPKRRSTFICSRGTLDGAYPSLILGINTVRQGGEAHVFFTFMGINILRKGYLGKLKFYPPGFLGAVPGMPTLATTMMKKQIEEANIPDIEELMEVAQIEGVQFVACKMTMDMMQLAEADLIEGITVMTADEYLKLADGCHINMFT